MLVDKKKKTRNTQNAYEVYLEKPPVDGATKLHYPFFGS
jgi:hypothetical protein